MRITIVAAAAGLALAGCEGGAPAPRDNAAGAEADANAVAPEEAPDPAAAAVARAVLPPYPGARQVRDGLDGGGAGSLTFATSDPTRPVIDFYAAAARRAGFEVEQHPPMGIALSMTGTRGDGSLVNVTASRVGEVTEVQAMIALGPR